MSEIRGLTDQAIDTNRPSRSSLDDLPADPPSPLTAAIHEWFTNYDGCEHFDKGHGAYAMCEDPDVGVPIKALPAILDAARAPDAGLRAAATRLVDAIDGLMPSLRPKRVEALSREVRAALASSPAPAGLDAATMDALIDTLRGSRPGSSCDGPSGYYTMVAGEARFEQRHIEKYLRSRQRQARRAA